MKPITPCWLCRELPRVNSLMVHDENPLLNPCDCFPFCDNCIYLEAWEEMQTRILGQRRKDFEAGRSIKNDEHGWIYIFQSFDDYIKEGA